MNTYQITYSDGLKIQTEASNMLELLEKHKESGFKIEGIITINLCPK